MDYSQIRLGIMVTVTVNDSKIKVPLTWEECDTHTYQRLMSAEKISPLKAFCLIVNKEYRLVADSTDDKLESMIFKVTDFVFNQPRYFEEFPNPETITILGIEFQVPKKLGRLTIEQNCIIRAKMAKQGVCLEELISWAMAVYLQPFITNTPFNFDEAEIIEKQVGKLRIYDTFPIGFFYLSKLNNSGAGGLLGWLQIKLLKMNLWQLSLRRLGSIGSPAFTTLPS